MDPFTLGFGEFQGIPKRILADDTIQYSIYIVNSSQSIAKLRERLEAVKDAAVRLAQDWGKEYIWQRDGFAVEITEAKGLLHLSGETEFGDSVDDEWFIVAILRELSRRFNELWIRVADTDGEFLLIEAANALPPWVKPEIMDHRVWINSGQLFLIAERNATTSAITLEQALDEIKSPGRSKVQRVRLVEEEAFYRVSKYPTAARDHLHYSVAKVPRKVALVLSEKPQYISAAVEEFYLRDPISLEACKIMKIFDPKDSVKISIKFTKVLYAQLRSQEFDPPLEAGFQIPPTVSSVRQGNELIEADIGMKVACGFEMLLSSQSIQSPKKKIIVKSIERILADHKLPSDATIATWPTRVDSDDWLDIDYSEFEKNLQGKSTKENEAGNSKQSSGYGHKAAEENLKKMVERFEKFLNNESAGLDGVNMDDDDDDDDEDETDEDTDEEDDDEDKGVSFDEAEFEQMMREMMGLPSEKQTKTADKEAEPEDIRTVMNHMEMELKEAGVIERPQQPQIRELNEDEDPDMEEDDDDEVNIDFNLAKNLLESFKGQGGMAGPGGNLLASMGISLPQDDDSDRKKGKGKS